MSDSYQAGEMPNNLMFVMSNFDQIQITLMIIFNFNTFINGPGKTNIKKFHHQILFCPDCNFLCYHNFYFPQSFVITTPPLLPLVLGELRQDYINAANKASSLWAGHSIFHQCTVGQCLVLKYITKEVIQLRI